MAEWYIVDDESWPHPAHGPYSSAYEARREAIYVYGYDDYSLVRTETRADLTRRLHRAASDG